MEKTEFTRRVRRARAQVADGVHAWEPIERAEAVANGDLAQAAAIDSKHRCGMLGHDWGGSTKARENRKGHGHRADYRGHGDRGHAGHGHGDHREAGADVPEEEKSPGRPPARWLNSHHLPENVELRHDEGTPLHGETGPLAENLLRGRHGLRAATPCRQRHLSPTGGVTGRGVSAEDPASRLQKILTAIRTHTVKTKALLEVGSPSVGSPSRVVERHAHALAMNRTRKITLGGCLPHDAEHLPAAIIVQRFTLQDEGHVLPDRLVGHFEQLV